MWRAIRMFARLLAMAFRQRKLDLTGVVVFGFIGAAAQLAAIAALLGFLRLLASSDQTEPVRWHRLELEPNLMSLGIISLLLGLLMIAATLASYLSARRARAIGRACEQAAAPRLFGRLGSLSRLPDGFGQSVPKSIAVRSCRLMGLAVEHVAKMVHPSLQLVVLGTGLFYIDAYTTLLLVPILIVPAVVLLRFHRSVRESARSYYDHAARSYGMLVARSLGNIESHRFQTSYSTQAVQAAFKNSTEQVRFLDSYDEVVLAADRSILITSLFRPLVLVYVLLLLGMSVTAGRASWPEVIAYIVLLIQVVGRAEGIITHLSILNREYTQIQPYMSLIEFAETQHPDSDEAAASEPVRFAVGDSTVEVAPGAPALVYTGRQVSRFSLPSLLDQLGSAMPSGLGALRACEYVGTRYRPAGGTCAQLAIGTPEPAQAELDRLHDLARRLGVSEDTDWMDHVVLDHRSWESLDDPTRTLLQIGPALFSHAPSLLVELAVINRLANEAAASLLDELSDRVVCILAHDERSWCVHASSVVVVRDERVVWCGPAADWRNHPMRAQATSSSGMADAVGADSDQALDDLELEMSEASLL
ncbi:MAG: ABC transporter ATP-binding protein [Planctomycetota bacterium]|nr:MAG: ABC transporter ATP-binding protein [Planctomycetota bacterium]